MEKNFNQSYIGERTDIEILVPDQVKMVLDVGCSVGTLGTAVKKKTGAKVFGIEISEEMASEAALSLDKVWVGDASSIISDGTLDDYKFDCIIFADVLEHLIDPWATLKIATSYLSAEGVIIASLPNVRHIYTIRNLVFKGYWPYLDRGIHDRTHLRFFTKKNIEELFRSSCLKIDTVRTNYRLIERPHSLNRYARFFALPGIKNFLAFQYIICSSKTEKQDK